MVFTDSYFVFFYQDELADSAGGFLAGADKVVKAFHLPKNTHPVLPPSASSSPRPATLATLPPNHHLSGASSSRKPKAAAEELEETSTDADAAPPDFITYDLEEETMDVDSDMMEEAGVLPGADGSSYRHQEGQQQRHQHVPKTLQQMAEDAAREQELGANAEKGDEIEEIIIASPITAGGRGTARRTRATTIKVPFPSKLSTLNIPSSTRSTPSTSGKVNSGSQPRRLPPRKVSNAKRKRTRGRKAGPESDSEDFSDQEEDENGSDDEEVAARPSPSKRPRGKTATAVAPVVTPPSTRTLRPRATKTAVQLEAERQSEAAFRSAVAR